MQTKKSTQYSDDLSYLLSGSRHEKDADGDYLQLPEGWDLLRWLWQSEIELKLGQAVIESIPKGQTMYLEDACVIGRLISLRLNSPQVADRLKRTKLITDLLAHPEVSKTLRAALRLIVIQGKSPDHFWDLTDLGEEVLISFHSLFTEFSAISASIDVLEATFPSMRIDLSSLPI